MSVATSNAAEQGPRRAVGSCAFLQQGAGGRQTAGSMLKPRKPEETFDQGSPALREQVSRTRKQVEKFGIDVPAQVCTGRAGRIARGE
jgi:hypothetical protein